MCAYNFNSALDQNKNYFIRLSSTIQYTYLTLVMYTTYLHFVVFGERHNRKLGDEGMEGILEDKPPYPGKYFCSSHQRALK